MRRKNPDTPPPPQDASFQESDDHDTYDAKEKVVLQQGEENKSDIPPPLPRPNKGAHVSFYDRQEMTKVEYQNDKNKQQQQQQRRQNSRRRSLLIDILCLCSVGAVCLSLSGIFGGFNQLLAASSITQLMGTTTAQIIQLPATTNLPAVFLLQSVHRHAVDDLYTNSMPLLFTELYTHRSMLQHAERQADESHYPEGFETNVNGGTMMDTVEIIKDFHHPPTMKDSYYQRGLEPDFGEVEMRFLTEGSHTRKIYRGAWERAGTPRTLDQPRDDDVEPYWAHDDDWLRNPFVTYDDDNIKDVHRCRRNSWTRKHFPVGNVFHEIDFVANVPNLVGEGAYREVFLFDQQVLGKTEKFVLKQIRYELDFEYDMFEYVRVDSIVTERLSSDNRIVDLFGYAGVALIAECFSNGDIEDDVVGLPDRSSEFNPMEEAEVTPHNNFTGSQKLKLARDMISAVASLHHFPDGVIVHDDIQLSQFLWTDETKTAVKLNDFNRAEVMLWDDELEEYCKYRNGRGHGDWRSPEEYNNDPINEKIDVWSLGNNIYSLLTGYYPFFDETDNQRIKRMIARGEVTTIDPRYHDRSFAESKLIDIMKTCYIFDPDERASIYELQTMLEDAIAEEVQRKESGEPWVYSPSDDGDDDDSDDDEDYESGSEYGHSGSESHISNSGGSENETTAEADKTASPVDRRKDSPLLGVYRNVDTEDAETHFEEEENDDDEARHHHEEEEHYHEHQGEEYAPDDDEAHHHRDRYEEEEEHHHEGTPDLDQHYSTY